MPKGKEEQLKRLSEREFYSQISDLEFDRALQEIVANDSDILSVPGVYEALADHYHNDALLLLWEEHQDEHPEEDELGDEDVEFEMTDEGEDSP